MVYIPSFCDIALGERLFRDARSYFNSLTRNAEAFSQIAARLKDTIFLTDDELYSVTITYINNQYDIRSTNLLNSQQKIDVARHLHINYNASKQGYPWTNPPKTSIYPQKRGFSWIGRAIWERGKVQERLKRTKRSRPERSCRTLEVGKPTSVKRAAVSFPRASLISTMPNPSSARSLDAVRATAR